MSNLSDASIQQLESHRADDEQATQLKSRPSQSSRDKKSASKKRKKVRDTPGNYESITRDPRARKYKDHSGKTAYLIPRFYSPTKKPSPPKTAMRRKEKKEKKKKMSPRRGDRSSPEYSSPHSQGNKNNNNNNSSNSNNAVHPLNLSPSTHLRGPSSPYPRSPAPGPANDGEDHMAVDPWQNTSDGEAGPAGREAMREQQQSDEDGGGGNLFSTIHHERRGKKGLSHAEMAMYGQRSSVAASPSNETEEQEEEEVEEIEEIEEEEDDEEGAENVQEELGEEEELEEDIYADDVAHMRRGERDFVYEDDDAEETEDEEADYSHGGRRVSGRSGTERRRSLWAQYPPIVSELAQMLEKRGVQPSQLAYASLTSAGRGAVNYLVRKQSVVIGRLEAVVDCCIKSETRSVSRRHARLFWNPHREEWVIECISEKSCVVVNGIPLVLGSAPIPVKSRDLIELGDVAFFFLAATSPVFLISDILKLERTIQMIRVQEVRAEAEEDRRRSAARLFGNVRDERSTYESRRSKPKGATLDRKRKAEDIGYDQRLNMEKGRKSHLSKKKAKLNPNHSYARGSEVDAKDMRKRMMGYSSARDSRRERDHRSETAGRPDDGGETEDENDKPSREMSKEGNHDEFATDFGSDLPLRDPFISNYNIRAKQSGGEADGEGKDNFDSAKHKEEWNKKERSDFCRALFAVGVDPIFAEDGSTERYDWARFRKIAELPKKSDLMLEDYYIQMMGDVRSLLEEEEREKRTKGPRTKHKPGCDCVVCENTRKSRRKKREQREGSNFEGGSGLDEDVDVKSTAKTSDKLVGLVTAQKLRVRLSIHEAARNVKSTAGESVFEKLEQQKDTLVRDFPPWWRSGYHDRALMRGTAIHGVGQWSDIWNDPRLKPFRKAKERNGSSIEWPSNQAAMKRVREISSSINAELRRKAKRAAKEERAVGHARSLDSIAHEKTRRAVTGNSTMGGKERKFSRARKGGKRSLNGSGDEYEALHDTFVVDKGREEDAEMTDESGLIQTSMGKDASQIETEDEDDVEVEVEEMEVEEEEDDQGQSDDEVGVDSFKGQVAAKQPAISVADISTDEEEDEDNIQYETASDSGTD